MQKSGVSGAEGTSSLGEPIPASSQGHDNLPYEKVNQSVLSIFFNYLWEKRHIMMLGFGAVVLTFAINAGSLALGTFAVACLAISFFSQYIHNKTIKAKLDMFSRFLSTIPNLKIEKRDRESEESIEKRINKNYNLAKEHYQTILFHATSIKEIGLDDFFKIIEEHKASLSLLEELISEHPGGKTNIIYKKDYLNKFFLLVDCLRAQIKEA
jgi:hypothetical protein